MFIKSPKKRLSVVILAGGIGKRLWPFTEMAGRSKPMVDFGKNKIIDFATSNAVNSGANHIYILPQYYSNDIVEYYRDFDFNAPMHGKTFHVFPPEHVESDTYTATANAVYQNIKYLKKDSSEVVAVLAADHIFKMDIDQVIDYHIKNNSYFTVCGYEVSQEDAREYGVMEVGNDNKIINFQEKPENPSTIPGTHDRSLASMGIYLVNKDILIKLLEEDHGDKKSTHDFGHNIITKLIQMSKEGSGNDVYCYPYSENRIPGEPEVVQTWRDVGNPLALFNANMEVVEPLPRNINLFNSDYWPIRTYHDGLGSSKAVFPKDEIESWKAEFPDTFFFPNYMAAGECILYAPKQLDLVNASRKVNTGWGVDLKEVVLFNNCTIGHHAKLYRTFVEEDVDVPPYSEVGFNVEDDLEHGILLGIDRALITNGEYKNIDPMKIIRIITNNHRLP